MTLAIPNVYGAGAMRARAGDPPRTMAQKILAGRCADPMLSGEMVQVKVDQIVLGHLMIQAKSNEIPAAPESG